MLTLFEHAGGEQGLHRLEQVVYDSVLADPLLQPLFGTRRPEHVDHLTAFTAESFGGPDRFSRELSFAHLISVHRGLRITEQQRQRFVELYMAALDAAETPADPAFRDAVRRHVEFGSKVAMQNSLADSDDELHPLREVPRWTWRGDDEDGAERDARDRLRGRGASRPSISGRPCANVSARSRPGFDTWW